MSPIDIRRLLSAALGIAVFCAAVGLAADDLSREGRPEGFPVGGEDRLAIPTLGGLQFWADVAFFHQWRIQRNIVTGHYRLLDEQERRHAWGTRGYCERRLEAIRRERDLPPMEGKAVVLLHGLTRSRTSMEPLARYLSEEGGYSVFNVGYPSTRGELADHAATLASVVDSLEGIEEISFVAHSMGNIVVRRFLADHPPDSRFQRMVMIAPPNQGSVAAAAWADNEFFAAITGEAGQAMGQEWDELAATLAVPAFEFGIIAGGRRDDRGFNPLIDGDDDGTLRVEETCLEGAADLVVFPALHSVIMYDEEVWAYTLRFLEEGHFVSAADRRPLPAAD